MDQTIRSRFISQQLLYFIAGRRCCQQFACTFRTAEHSVFIYSARTLGLRSQVVLTNGQECVKVFKQTCRHYLEEPKLLALSPSTVMYMFPLLARANVKENNLDYVENLWTIQPPSLHISLAALGQSTTLKKHCKSLPNALNNSRLNEILESINGHRLTVFDGNLSLDKSILFPLIILKDSESKKKNIRIICIEDKDILAIYNCERFAECLGENIGETVGIQVPQHNSISSITQVVYTTATYFLRTLFNKNATNKFNQISHFVVNDVHLHAPYTDILLFELKQALRLEQNLRIILLSQACDPTRFVNFFGEGKKFCIKPTNLFTLSISYLEDIQNTIAAEAIDKGPEIYKKQRQMFRNKNKRNEQIDKCLQAYEEIGTDVALRPVLYLINYELVPVDYQHSLTGKTAIYIAAQLGKVHHLRLLLFMGANPKIVSESHENAITIAAAKGNVECVDILNNFCLHGYFAKNAKPQFVDYDVIVDLIYLIYAKRHFSTGNLQEFSIFLLHKDMDKEYLYSLMKSPLKTRKIVLATDIIELLPIAISFQYLIDTACQKKSLYDGISNSIEERYEWAAKDCLLRRQLILDTSVDEAITEKHCFRLISRDIYDGLSESSQPPMQTMQLDKICLTVKLLCPSSCIREYLTNTIAPPSVLSIHQNVAFLKKIEVLDQSEAVTWLGCRLIDIPVSCQMGRTLIFGILLQCLDPILTIVSSLSTADPLTLPFNDDIDSIWNKFTIYIQNCIKGERARLAEDQLSDHIIFVRLFLEWQAGFKNNTVPLYLTDEYDFVLNGLMEQLNLKRMKIVSALRAANLVHSHGQLSIQNVNIKSNNWPLVKAALTGGMYPNICAVDQKQKSLHSGQSTNVYLLSNSVLRNFLEPFQTTAQWIVCTKEKNIIRYATAVTPLAVAMFAGSEKVGFGHSPEISSPSAKDNISFFIDEWIWLSVSKYDFDLVVKTRQEFFKAYQYFLKHCSALDKWRNDSKNPLPHLLFETLTKILENEDAAAGFKKCSNIGFRPALKLPNLYLLSVNSHFTWQQMDEANMHRMEKHFFLLYTQDNPNSFYRKSDAAYMESILGKFVRPIDSATRHIYLILYSKKPDVALSICRAQIQNDEFVLKEYFRNTIALGEILQACASLNVPAPNFDGRHVLRLVDKRVGNLIMDLFAFRHHWIHTHNN
ncbi:benign gonial cell neoplasm protein isoform X2 [Drosophila hydei]|uniref:Benign gonial cell neoplasm protein isoform X2 n=1 Tax=Drosophila hydei TaxID=7224 RepID=A0A6J1LYV0_DROHY|nr:benign gonial cell neoplasm protein isoform X2 [Drosophila hydei]